MLLPIAERVAPDLCREIMWRSLALRLPRPRRDHFDDEVETTDLELAKMLARYDRDLARHLLEPLAEPIEQLMLPGTTALKSPHASEAAQSATRWARDLVVAAVHVDPHLGRELLDRIIAAVAASKYYIAEGARQSFVWTLARHGPDRWLENSVYCAGFWSPRKEHEWRR